MVIWQRQACRTAGSRLCYWACAGCEHRHVSLDTCVAGSWRMQRPPCRTSLHHTRLQRQSRAASRASRGATLSSLPRSDCSQHRCAATAVSQSAARVSLLCSMPKYISELVHVVLRAWQCRKPYNCKGRKSAINSINNIDAVAEQVVSESLAVQVYMSAASSTVLNPQM